MLCSIHKSYIISIFNGNRCDTYKNTEIMHDNDDATHKLFKMIKFCVIVYNIPIMKNMINDKGEYKIWYEKE